MGKGNEGTSREGNRRAGKQEKEEGREMKNI